VFISQQFGIEISHVQDDQSVKKGMFFLSLQKLQTCWMSSVILEAKQKNN
jgi:hypothetical protein